MPAPKGTPSSATRFRQTDYTLYAAHLRKCLEDHPDYVGEEARGREVERVVAGMQRRDDLLAAGICPDCGAPAVVYIENETGRGAAGLPCGPPDGHGEGGYWLNFRCSRDNPPGETTSKGERCGFMLDQWVGS